MTNERAAKIILDLINAGEAEYRNFSVEEIRALKKAYVALNSEPTTNADRIRAMSDEKLAEQLYLLRLDALRLEGFEGFIETKDEVLEWLKEEAGEN